MAPLKERDPFWCGLASCFWTYMCSKYDSWLTLTHKKNPCVLHFRKKETALTPRARGRAWSQTQVCHKQPCSHLSCSPQLGVGRESQSPHFQELVWENDFTHTCLLPQLLNGDASH